MFQKTFIAIMAATLLFAVFTTDILAATATDPMVVSASIVNSCTIVTADLAFGTYDPFSVPNLDVDTTVTITCTSGVIVPVDLSNGSNFGVGPTRRMLSGVANYMNYQIYTDAARTSIWGSGITGGSTVTRTGTGAADPITAYGRIPAGQTSLPAGAYSDTVTATVTF